MYPFVPEVECFHNKSLKCMILGKQQGCQWQGNWLRRLERRRSMLGSGKIFDKTVS